MPQNAVGVEVLLIDHAGRFIVTLPRRSAADRP